MVYDAAGRVASATDPKAQTSSFTFNAVGQPVTAQLPGETITYAYGTNGRTESVTDNRGTTTLTYHPGTDWVASVTDPVTGGFSYSYDLAGAKAAMTLPGGGQWQFQWNYLNCSRGDGPDKLQPRLEQVVDDQGRIVKYNLDNFGGLDWAQTNITYSGGSPTSYLKTSYGYDLYNNNSHTRQRMVQVSNRWHWQDAMGQWQSKVLVQNDYTYDNTGTRTANAISDWTGPIRTESYGYDELTRLTSVNYGDGQTQGYTFDAMGNRATKSDSIHGNDTYTHNAANMLLTRNGNPYTNDVNGNTLTGGGGP